MNKVYSEVMWLIFNTMTKQGYTVAVASEAASAGAKAACNKIATRAGDDIADYTTNEYPPVVPVCSPMNHAY